MECDVDRVRGRWRRYAETLPFSLDYPGFEAELAGLPRPHPPPHGVLRIAVGGDACLGAVGLKRLAPGVGEIKRLDPRRRRLYLWFVEIPPYGPDLGGEIAFFE